MENESLYKIICIYMLNHPFLCLTNEKLFDEENIVDKYSGSIFNRSA